MKFSHWGENIPIHLGKVTAHIDLVDLIKWPGMYGVWQLRTT